VSLADQVEIYVSVLLRWGAEVAFNGASALIARDSQSRWFEINN
jgi:hypothetical protein